MEVYKNNVSKSIDLYKNTGFVLVSPLRGGLSVKTHNIEKRGKIKGWSSFSRRRMRTFLIENKFPPGWLSFGITLTIPGYPLTYKESKRLFKLFNTYSQRLPFEFAAVQRMEIQQRGSIHWHLVAGGDCMHLNVFQIYNIIRGCWFKSLKALGQVEDKYIGSFKYPMLRTDLQIENQKQMLIDLYNSKQKRKLTKKQIESFIPTFDYWKLVSTVLGGYPEIERNFYTGEPDGVSWVVSPIDKYACKLEFFPSQDYGSWLRYLNDHTSKSKQEQIPNSFGRHWGYINKKAFVPAVPQKIELTDKQFIAVKKWQHRLQTPIIFDKENIHNWMFQKHKGQNWNSKRSPHGSSVYFGSPETLKRMIDFAIENITDTRETPQVLNYRVKSKSKYIKRRRYDKKKRTD